MSMKECPSCGTSVPASASRCKECFHDFAEAPAARSWFGPLLILGAVAASAVIAALTLFMLVGGPEEERVLVDGESQSIIFTRKFQDDVQTERIPFSQVAKIEYVVANGKFEVFAIKADGGRASLAHGAESLEGEAAAWSRIMGKPLETIDHSSGAH